MTNELFMLFVLLAAPLAGLATVWPTTNYLPVIADGGSSIANKILGNWSFSSSSNGCAIQEPRILFSYGFGAGIGQVEDKSYGFIVIVPSRAAPIADDYLVMLGAVFSGTGSASIAESVWMGCLFGNVYGVGKFVRLFRFDNSTLVMLSDSITFAPVTVDRVIKDLEETGDTDITVGASAMKNQFSGGTTPEPGTLALLGIGVICLGGFLRWRLGSNRL
jgi:PEP-CTERM motif